MKRSLRPVYKLYGLCAATDLGRPLDPLVVAGQPLRAEAMQLYLHACTGLLAVVGKIGQLYVQDFPDTAAVAAVDRFENLATGLSGKIWRKLMILDRAPAGTAEEALLFPTDGVAPGAPAK